MASYTVFADAVIQFDVTDEELAAHKEAHGRSISPNEYVKHCRCGAEGKIATWKIDRKATVKHDDPPPRKVIRSSQSY